MLHVNDLIQVSSLKSTKFKASVRELAVSNQAFSNDSLQDSHDRITLKWNFTLPINIVYPIPHAASIVNR